MIECRVDGCPVFGDPFPQLGEGCDAAAAGPTDPLIEQHLALLAFECEHFGVIAL